jgi:hypothetical protein
MEDYVYIILAVVWLLISILGNKKRKAQQQQQQQPKQEQKSFDEQRPQPVSKPQPIEPSEFEVLLDDFFGDGTKSKKPEPKPEPEAEKEEKHVFSDEYTFQGRKGEEYNVKEEIPSSELEKYEGKLAIDDDYEFSAEASLESIEDYIKSYDDQDRIAEERDSQLVVVDLDEEYGISSDLEFDGRKAIIYSEIINRRYT